MLCRKEIVRLFKKKGRENNECKRKTKLENEI